MKRIAFIWGIFTLIFFMLGLIYHNRSKKEIEHFEIKKSEAITIDAINGFSLDFGFDNFVVDFNAYIDELNSENRKQNQISSFGYFIASLTSFFSLLVCMGLFSKKPKKIE